MADDRKLFYAGVHGQGGLTMMRQIGIGVSIVAISGICTSLLAIQNTQAAPTPPPPNTVVTSTFANVVDDIAIPGDVGDYAQMQYQGYAVTHARKGSRNGQQLYILTITRDDTGSNYDGFFLYYDMTWKLLGDQKLTTPPPAPKQEEPANDSEPQDTRDRDKPKPEENNAHTPGRGGGAETTQPVTTPTPPPPTMPPMPATPTTTTPTN